MARFNPTTTIEFTLEELITLGDPIFSPADLNEPWTLSPEGDPLADREHYEATREAAGRKVYDAVASLIFDAVNRAQGGGQRGEEG